MKRKYLSALLTVALLIPTLTAFKCSKTPADTERNLTAIGYDILLGFQAATRTAQALNIHGRFNDTAYSKLVPRLAGLIESAQRYNTHLDKVGKIDVKNKQALIDFISDFIRETDRILADGLLTDADSKQTSDIRKWLLIATSLAQSSKVALAAIQIPTPTEQVLVSQETQKHATQIYEANSSPPVTAMATRAAADSNMLTQDIIAISTDFLVAVLQQRGQPTAELRTRRNTLYESLKAFCAAELQRVSAKT